MITGVGVGGRLFVGVTLLLKLLFLFEAYENEAIEKKKTDY